MIAYRILLTVPITVAFAERSFSKLKLLKSYLRTSMSQGRLNGLALMAIENGFLEELDVESLADDFASDHSNRTTLFT
ncbi:putative HAT dimerization domain-containing protein [Arabidopsis thaliana]